MHREAGRLKYGLVVLAISAGAFCVCAQEAKPSLISPFKKTAPSSGQQRSVTAGEGFNRSALAAKEIVALELSNAETPEALKIISDISGWSIIPSENLKGKVSFFAKNTNCGDLLDSLAKANNWTLVQEGQSILVMSQDEYMQQFGPNWKVIGPEHSDCGDMEKAIQAALSKNGKVVSNGKGGLIVIDGPRNLQRIEEAVKEFDAMLVSRVFDLPGGNGAFAAETLRAVLSKDATVAVDAGTGRLVVRDSRSRLDEAADVLAQLNQGVLTEVFSLSNATAADVAIEIERIVSDATSIRCDARTNQLILTENETNLERVRGIIEKLDRADGMFTRTFYLEHGDCMQVQQTLLDILGRNPGAPAMSPAPAPRPRIQPDVVVAPAARTEPIKGADVNTPAGQADAKPAPTSDAKPARPASAMVSKGPEYASEAAGGPTIAADPRINALIVTDSTSMLNRIEGLIKELDREEKLHVYRMNYGDPTAIKMDEKLGTVLNQPNESYAVDEISRTVTFNAGPGKASQVMKLLSEWDRQPRQIYLEAKVVSIDRLNSTEVGTEFDAILSELTSQITPFTRVKTSFPGTTVTTPGSLIQVGSLDSDHYQALLRLIETRAETQLLSSPKVVALDGNPAQFQVATDEPYTEVSTDPEGNRIVENVRFIPVGVILNVVPKISEDGFITMDVVLEVSSLKEVRDGVPVVSRSATQSRVVVEKGHTLIIGGLIDDKEIEVQSGVPVLQRIPLLGWLFRNTRKQHFKSELVLLLTPHIVTEETKG